MKKLFELRQDVETLKAEGRTIVDKAVGESRKLTPEEDTKVKEVRSKIEDLNGKIATFELRDGFEALTPEERAANGGILGPDLPNLDGKRPYSLVRALNMQLQVREGKGKYSGLEYEVHQELEKHAFRSADGIRVPWNLRNETLAQKAREQRDVTTSTISGGIANVLGTELIEILRNKMVMKALGARLMEGLVGGTFSLPKQTGTSTAYYVAEGIGPGSSNPVLGQVTWTPRTLGATINTSRKALLQSSLDVEAMTRSDAMAVMGIEFDRVGINGLGNNFQPMGILQDPNVPTVAIGANGGVPTWANIVGLESQVAQANADFGSLGYLCSNKGRALLKTTPKIGSTFPVFLWEDGAVPGEGMVNSYRAMSTNQVPDYLAKGSSGAVLSALIFGNFASATYALWGGMDVIVDPYTGSQNGSVRITCFQDFDFQQRYEQAYAKSVDLAV